MTGMKLPTGSGIGLLKRGRYHSTDVGEPQKAAVQSMPPRPAIKTCGSSVCDFHGSSSKYHSQGWKKNN